MIKEYPQVFEVKMMCRVLSVSRSGYYDWGNVRDLPR